MKKFVEKQLACGATLTIREGVHRKILVVDFGPTAIYSSGKNVWQIYVSVDNLADIQDAISQFQSKKKWYQFWKGN